MNFWIKKKKTICVTLGLLGAMLVCTLISKSVYATMLPQVTAQEARTMSINHEVEASGVVKQNREFAVSALAGLKVNTIYVGVGDQIEEETILFDINQEDLKQQIAKLTLEIKKQELQLEAIKENQNNAQLKSQIEENRIAEDYNLTDTANNRQIEQAQQKENQAEGELQNHLTNKPHVTSEEERNSKRNEYQEWKKTGEALTATVEEAKKKVAEAEKIVQDTQIAYDTAGEDEKEELEKKLAEAIAARDSIQASLKEKQAELELYQANPLSEPDFSAEDSRMENWNKSKEILEKNKQSAVLEKEDRKWEKQEELLDAQRKLEDSKLPDTEDNTIEVTELELDYNRKVLSQYQKVLQNKGQVKAEGQGIVTAIKISVGDNIPDGASIVYASQKENLQFLTLLTPEEKKYVNQGMEVEVQFQNKLITEKIDYILEENGNYQVMINLENEIAGMGESGKMKAKYQSESYRQCIPTSALNVEKNNYFVYVIREQEGILGTELAAEKRYVTVKDKNNSYVAIQDGDLKEGEQVIDSTTKELKDGEVVKFRLPIS